MSARHLVDAAVALFMHKAIQPASHHTGEYRRPRFVPARYPL